ncbi:MAG: hypothetical protein IPO35_17425 [Uliginosibacterium sp.]|nr:hypothetical protein [Uliginosibacterium sp.]
MKSPTYSGGQSFFERTEIRDLLSYLRLIANGDDDLASTRAVTTPRRGIGAATLEALGRYAGARHISLFCAASEEGGTEHLPARQLETLRNFTRFIHQLEHRATREPAGRLLNELLSAIWRGLAAGKLRCARSRTQIQQRSRLYRLAQQERRRRQQESSGTHPDHRPDQHADNDEEDIDAVQLSPFTPSKGLEFPHVFLVGVEEGPLPHQSSIDEDKG